MSGCVSGQEFLALCFRSVLFPPHPTVLSQRQSTGPPFSGPPVLLNPSHQHLGRCRGPAGTKWAGTAQPRQIQLHRSKGRLNTATISVHSLCSSLWQPAPPPQVGDQNQPATLFVTYASVTPCKSMPGSLSRSCQAWEAGHCLLLPRALCSEQRKPGSPSAVGGSQPGVPAPA